MSGAGELVGARKGQIRDLLRGARARLHPAEFGLRDSGRRKKVPGLRREDVAVLAQVSLKWYTWLEQGRELNFSEELLYRIARTLRLLPCEAAYLVALTRRSASREVTTPASSATDWLLRTILFAPVPVIAMTLRWDIVAWNELTTCVFRDYGAVPSAERNLLKIVMTDPRYRRDPEAFEQFARRLLGEFRLDFGHCAGDPKFERLIAELCETVPDFARLWSRVELWSAPRARVIEHDELGDLYFDRVTYLTEYHPRMRVVMFIPGDANTARVIAGLERPMENEIARASTTRELSAATCAVAAGALRMPRVVTAKQVVRPPSSGATRMMLGEDVILLSAKRAVRPQVSGAAGTDD
jgi:transcriptional regulator with XRE-family HTH domain